MVVKVENLSITYRTTFERVPTFKNAITRLGRGQRAVREVEALKDVSFEVPDGTALGIIGNNGAGKSTLMRAMAGILPPNQGRIEVNGRVSPLLSLGVGFNANLSGRENIVLGGLASGLSRKAVAARAEAVTEFAELDEFIDAPMRTYSSGVLQPAGLLGAAVHMDPDILMIDEALSAGDAFIQDQGRGQDGRAAHQRPRLLPGQPLAVVDQRAVQRRPVAAQGQGDDAR